MSSPQPTNPKKNNHKRRNPDAPTMSPTDNDVAVLRLVYQYRLLSQRQLEALVGKSPAMVQRITRRLFDAEFLDRRFLPVLSRPQPRFFLYVLDRRGADLLRSHGETEKIKLVPKDATPTFLEHTFAINEVRIRVTLACQKNGFELVTWKGENEIKAGYDRVAVPGKAESVALVPDSYFVVKVPNKGTSHFFLELDRGTMDLDRFREKVEAYVSYQKSGAFERRYSAKSFRVLTIVDPRNSDGKLRTRNLKMITETVAGIGRRFWFAPLPTLTSENVLTSPAWQLPNDSNLATLLE